MNKELKKRWIKDLRSNKYKQGKAYLQKNGEYCCLGVLADRLAHELPQDIIWGEGRYGTKELVDVSAARSDSALLPDTLAIGLELYDVQEELAAMNDNGSSFKVIANWIEKNV